jgi:hypothetical protein
LWVCYSATTTGGPEGDIAQIVANRTRIPVVAPTDEIEVAGEVIRHSNPQGEDVSRTPWQPPTMQVPAIQIPKFK